MIIAQPFEVTSTVGQFDVIATVGGGGPDGPGRRGAPRPRPRARALRREAPAGRSRRPGSSRAIRACASGRSTVSPAPARSSSTRSDRVAVTTTDRFALPSPAPAGTWARSCCGCSARAPAGRRSPASPPSVWPASRWLGLPASARTHRSRVSRSRRRLARGRRRRRVPRAAAHGVAARGAGAPAARPQGHRSLGRLPAARSATTTSPGTRRRTSIRAGSARRCTGCPSCIARRSRAPRWWPRPAAIRPGPILATAPLFKSGLARLDGIVIDGKSGVTGAGAQGRKIDPMYLFTEANENVQAYGIAAHRHTPEIEQELIGAGGQRRSGCRFTPHLVPLNRGLFTTASVPLASALATARAARRLSRVLRGRAVRARARRGRASDHAARRRLELLRRHRGGRPAHAARRSACRRSTTSARAAPPTACRTSTS